MNGLDNPQNTLNEIVQLAKQGNKEQAKTLLSDYLKQNPNDADGWYLAARFSSDPSRRRRMLERALSANPSHTGALTALKQLTAVGSAENHSRIFRPVNVGNRNFKGRSVTLTAVLVVTIVLITTIVGVKVSLQIGQGAQPAKAASTSDAQAASTAVAFVEQKQSQRWEYLIFSYYGVDTKADRYGETITISDAKYNSLVQEPIDAAKKCGVTDPFLFTLDNGEQNCLAKSMKGTSYYINRLGDDGWELVNSLADTSGEVLMVFERSKQ